MKSTVSVQNNSRYIQYPWGTVCPLYWHKAFVVMRWDELDDALVSSMIQHLAPVCPNIEWTAQGELILDIKRVQKLYSSPVNTAKQLIAALPECYQTTVQVGLSDNEYMAILASHLPQLSIGGVRVIPAWDSARILSSLRVMDIEPLIAGATDFFHEYGIQQLSKINTLPRSLLDARFGVFSKALILLSQGKTVPRHLWQKTPPRELSRGERYAKTKSLHAEAIEAIKQHAMSLLQQQHWAAEQWLLECQQKNQTSLQRMQFTEQLVESLCVRWIARTIYPDSAQHDLFSDWLAPTDKVPEHLSLSVSH